MTLSVNDTRFCSLCARQAGLSPIGYGGTDYAIIIAAELPLPWPKGMFSDVARMPAEVLMVMEHIHREYERTHEVRIRPLGIAPDADYSVAGMRRVIAWRRPQGAFARFDRSEYLVPEDQLGPLVYALALAPVQLDAFAPYRQEVGAVRDLLVCTHGSVDAACSKFGYPTYAHLRRLAADSGGRLRAWRTTHFGGHVFAPTLIDLPHGSYWAYIEAEVAELLVRHNSDPTRLREHYRGWAGLPAPLLTGAGTGTLCAAWLAVLHYAKSGRVLAQDETAEPDEHGDVEPTWAEVQLDYVTPDGAASTVNARIEVTNRLDVIYSSGNDETYAYPQYTVAWLQTAPSAPAVIAMA
jgi:hypothetical protein